MKHVPPRFARLLLRLVVPSRDREYVVRDLAEEFDALLVAGKDLRTARRWYWRQVLASVPSSVTRRRHRKAGVSAGRLMAFDSLWLHVYDDGVGRDPGSIVYWPISSGSRYTMRSLGYAIRSQRLDDPSFLSEVRRAVWSVNPNLAVADVRTLEEMLERSMARTSFTLILLVVAATMAVLLGLVGVYGVISYVVARRTREIGLHMALGASASHVRRQVLKQGMVLAGLGITLLASYLPARRAMRGEPMEALR